MASKGIVFSGYGGTITLSNGTKLLITDCEMNARVREFGTPHVSFKIGADAIGDLASCFPHPGDFCTIEQRTSPPPSSAASKEKIKPEGAVREITAGELQELIKDVDPQKTFWITENNFIYLGP